MREAELDVVAEAVTVQEDLLCESLEAVGAVAVVVKLLDDNTLDEELVNVLEPDAVVVRVAKYVALSVDDAANDKILDD